MKSVELLQIDPDSRLVILTGAGISAESGIQTFRASDGLWENHRVEDVATPDGFIRNPQLVQKFYNERRVATAQARPNQAHFAIAEIQKTLGDRCFLVTQNIDDLHERAGSPQVSHMHGEVFKVRCLDNENHILPWSTTHSEQDRCPICGGKLRPHIVWFGEMPFDMELIEEQLSNCTHFFSIGTSGNVYPAAGFRQLARYNGANVYHFNLVGEPKSMWDDQFIGPAGEIVPRVSNWICSLT